MSHLIQYITGHFRDESYQKIDCTGTDNQTITNTKYTKSKLSNPNKLTGPSKNTKPDPKTVHL